MTCRLRRCVEIETRCRTPIWRMFRRIQWHVIPEPHITLQGAATWWIHCHDSRATCHTASMLWLCHIAGCKNSIRHIENRFRHILFFFVFNAFDERRLSYRLRYTCFIGFFIYCSTVVSSGIVLHVFTRYGYITRYATMATPVQSLLLAAWFKLNKCIGDAYWTFHVSYNVG